MTTETSTQPEADAKADSDAKPDKLGAAKILKEDAVPDASAAAPEKLDAEQQERSRRIKKMFGDISHAYDLNNHLLSLNIDKRWRSKTVELALEGRRESVRSVLDCCSGTGDLALELSSELGPEVEVVGTDFTPKMVELAQEKGREAKSPATFFVGDTMQLPFEDNRFDLATVAFGIRNVADLQGGIAEMVRVLKPGGRLVILEFTPLRNPLLRKTYRYYFEHFLPCLGGMISGRMDAYKYLAQSVEEFPDCDDLKQKIEAAGVDNVRYQRLTFGVSAVHLGEKK
jgi:demethylmenaquinone methyltransferase/2-methoxy-6-polyprenyl-1,4-benzoquinol methylase